MEKSIKYIVSTLDNKTSGKNGYDELKDTFKALEINFKLEKWLSYGTFIVDVCIENENFVKICDESFFIRHIFPCENVFENIDAMDNLDRYFETLDLNLIKDEIVGVQGFSFMDNEYFRKSEFALKLENFLKEKNIEVDNKNANYVFSFVQNKEKTYIGKSYIKDNLTSWILGNVRLKKDDEQISRAAFKLDEAFSFFNIEATFNKAVDLGASPGGWTKVLADKGMIVYAVDPATLDPKLKKYSNIKFFNMLSQEFVSKTTEKFDLIVNDMKMDVVKSCEITCELEKILEKDGFGIITFKLPENKQRGKILDGLRVLSVCYDVLKVKQLHHNRHEVTVLFQKRG
ncbi:MAG: SAM-dependent methyltransferase [Lachnospirales bacterium]